MKNKNIRKYLVRYTCKLLIYSIVMSHIDYANGLLAGATELVLGIYQRIQSFAAKVVLNHSKLKQGLSFNCSYYLQMSQRQYTQIFKDLLVLNKLSGHNLLSHTRELKTLIIAFVHNRTFAACSFSAYGPKCRNSLPINIHSISNVDDFKKGLKTYLFHKYLADDNIYMYY